MPSRNLQFYLRSARERAFTLIELLVVILIIGILIAVAAPSFLGQTHKAQDSVSQQDISLALTEAKADWTEGSAPGIEGFSSQTSLYNYLQSSEPGFNWTNGVSPVMTDYTNVDFIDKNTVIFCNESGGGTVFCVEDSEVGGLTPLFPPPTNSTTLMARARPVPMPKPGPSPF
jgi:type IV pilus assembly protein PilA